MLKQTTDHTGTTTNQLVGCPFCGEEITGQNRVDHLQTCEERPI